MLFRSREGYGYGGVRVRGSTGSTGHKTHVGGYLINEKKTTYFLITNNITVMCDNNEIKYMYY